MKIFVADRISPAGVEHLRNQEGFEVVEAYGSSPEEVLELAKELVRRAAAEQRRDYGGIRVGLLRREVAAFKRTHAGKRVVTHADLRALL